VERRADPLLARRVLGAEGAPPSPDDLDGPFWTGPSAWTLRRRFGGVEVAGRALAPVPADVTGAEAAETPLEVALVGLMHG
jgi:hypothetical protein